MAQVESLAGRATMAHCHTIDPSLPNDWTCPDVGDVCLSLRASTAAYCCPQGVDCNRIAPIECASQVLRHYGTLAPNPRIFLRNSTSVVETCGGANCCPLGYHCLYPEINFVPEHICRIDGFDAITPNKDSASEAALASTASADLPTGAISPTNAPTGLPTPSNPQDSNNTAEPDASSGHTDTSVIVGATLASAVGIIAIVLAVMIYLRYMRKTAAEETDKAEADSEGQEKTEYWSYDGRKDATGRTLSRWSSSTLGETGLGTEKADSRVD